MSILDQEEFKQLRNFKGKVDSELVKRILEDVELDFEKSGNIKSSIIFIYTNYIQQIKQNRDFFNLLSAILEKYTPKLGIDNVNQLILSSIS